MDDSNDREASPSSPQKIEAPKRLQLDENYTTRILFVLAFLGVLLAVNGVANHYNYLGFIYTARHDWFLKGPYHVRAIIFFNGMEVLLALAVYVYAFDFIFKKPVFQRSGDVLYATALLGPPIYVGLAVVAFVSDAENHLSTPLFYVVDYLIKIVTLLTLPLIIALIALIADRLQGGRRDPFAEARKKFKEERSERGPVGRGLGPLMLPTASSHGYLTGRVLDSFGTRHTFELFPVVVKLRPFTS